MNCGTLALKPRPQQIQRIHQSSAETACARADESRHDVSRRGVLFAAVTHTSIAGGDELLEVAEGSEVNGAVGEDADKAHGEAAVEGPEAVGGPHFAGGGEDESVSVLTALDGFALHAAGMGC